MSIIFDYKCGMTIVICDDCRKEVYAPMPVDWEETDDKEHHCCGECRKAAKGSILIENAYESAKINLQHKDSIEMRRKEFLVDRQGLGLFFRGNKLANRCVALIDSRVAKAEAKGFNGSDFIVGFDPWDTMYPNHPDRLVVDTKRQLVKVFDVAKEKVTESTFGITDIAGVAVEIEPKGMVEFSSSLGKLVMAGALVGGVAGAATALVLDDVLSLFRSSKVVHFTLRVHFHLLSGEKVSFKFLDDGFVLHRKSDYDESSFRQFVDRTVDAKGRCLEFLNRHFSTKLNAVVKARTKTKGSYKGNINKLIDKLINKSPRIREDTVKTLSEVGTMEAVEAIIEALKDENVQVRFAAVLSLRKINDTKVVDPLIAALEDNEDYVKRNAAGALGELGDTGAIGPLLNVLQKNESAGVKNDAAKALVNITGNDFGLDSMRWLDWWQQSKVMQQKGNELDKKVIIDSVETCQALKNTITDKEIPSPHPAKSVEHSKTLEDERVSPHPKISIPIVEDSKLKKYVEIYGRPLKTEETSIIDAWHRIVGERQKEVYTYPNIPEKKLSNAKASFAKISPEELIIGLQDSTEFGSATEGILATTKGIYWKSVGNLHSESVYYCDIDSCKVSYKRTMFSTWIIILGEERNIELSVSSKHPLEALSSFISEVVLIGKSGQNS